MSQQWYYLRAGVQTGPIDTDGLRRLIGAGQVTPEDLVWTDQMPEWRPAVEVPAFFAPDLAYAPPAHGPQLGYAGPATLHYQTPDRRPQYAGFWLRFCAAFVDGIIVWVVQIPIDLALGIPPFDPEAAARVGVGPMLISNLISIVGVWLYEALMESSARQATLGKMAVGIIVTDARGARVSFGRATGRHFGKILSALILCIGFIMAGYTRRKQALHDQLADCLVVKR